MRNDKNGILVGILIGLVIAFLVGVELFVTGSVSFKDNKCNNLSLENNKQDNLEKNTISEKDILKVIEDELFVFFMHSNPNRHINDLDNQSKLYMALLKMQKEYIRSTNDVYSEIESFSKKAIEDSFKSSCLGNLSIEHEDIAEFKYDAARGMYDNSHLMPKIGYRYMRPHAKKVVDFKEENNIYSISIKYLFPDDQMGFQYYYGDLEKKNQIVKAYEGVENYIDAQEYLDNNYESIKEKLATYNYQFEYKNNKLLLTDFSIS